MGEAAAALLREQQSWRHRLRPLFVATRVVVEEEEEGEEEEEEALQGWITSLPMLSVPTICSE